MWQVTRIYRKYIDLYFENSEEYKVDPADIKALQQLFSRGGFTEDITPPLPDGDDEH